MYNFVFTIMSVTIYRDYWKKTVGAPPYEPLVQVLKNKKKKQFYIQISIISRGW